MECGERPGVSAPHQTNGARRSEGSECPAQCPRRGQGRCHGVLRHDLLYCMQEASANSAAICDRTAGLCVVLIGRVPSSIGMALTVLTKRSLCRLPTLASASWCVEWMSLPRHSGPLPMQLLRCHLPSFPPQHLAAHLYPISSN